MRRFSAAYLRESRRGLWAADQAALADLDLEARERIVDVGAGTGAFTRLLREAADARVVAVDGAPDLLSAAAADGRVAGDATRLPLRDGAADLVACQALLVNLCDPEPAVREFARVSSDLVAAVEPDNDGVAIASSVDAEPGLARRAREAYMADLDVDPGLGAGAGGLFRDADLCDVRTTRHVHTRTTEPPYTERDLRVAREKARGSRLDRTREAMLDGGLTVEGFAALRSDWRAMGRTVADQMSEETYHRVETIPLYVTVGRVS